MTVETFIKKLQVAMSKSTKRNVVFDEEDADAVRATWNAAQSEAIRRLEKMDLAKLELRRAQEILADAYENTDLDLKQTRREMKKAIAIMKKALR
jgi:hypothetical protein